MKTQNTSRDRGNKFSDPVDGNEFIFHMVSDKTDRALATIHCNTAQYSINMHKAVASCGVDGRIILSVAHCMLCTSTEPIFPFTT